jgi:hypothetical protein
MLENRLFVSEEKILFTKNVLRLAYNRFNSEDS